MLPCTVRMLFILTLLFKLSTDHSQFETHIKPHIGLPIRLCIAPTFASRTGQESCWALFHLDEQRTICITHSAWYQWLSSSHPPSICENPDLPWKEYSHLENSTPHTSFKKVTKTQLIKSFSQFYAPSQSIPLIYAFLQKIENIRERTSALIRPNDPFGIVRSLLLDEKSKNTPLAMFRILGFVHLLSATGIHLYTISVWMDNLSQGLCTYLRIPLFMGLWIARIASSLCIFTLWVLNGARFGMLRPWILMMIRKMALLLGFRWKKASPLCCAICIDLAISAFRSGLGLDHSAYSGRWIYALAVGGGLFWYQSFYSVHIGLAIGSWLLVALWDAWESGLIALATPLLSLITLPILCLFGYPLLVISVFFNEAGFNNIALPLIQGLSKSLSFFIFNLCQIVTATRSLWIVPRWAVLIAMCASTVILAYRSSNQRKIYFSVFCISLALLSRILIHSFTYAAESKRSSTEILRAKKVEQIDVGQGDAALISESKMEFGMIDTGSKRSLLDADWIRFLGQRQITQISWIALTHLDEDHAGGIIRLAKIIPIQCVAITEGELHSKRGYELLRTLQTFKIQVRPWNSSCIPYPTYESSLTLSARSRSNSRSHRNENMGAVWIPLQSGGFYLSAGDASASDEIPIGEWAQSLMNQNPLPYFPRILKISHHGSASSTSIEFLERLRPTNAWISVGVGNRYGHPTLRVLNQLHQTKIPIHRTDREGSLSSP